MSKRVLLTGATGFVGRNLAPALLAAGHTIRRTSRDPDLAAKTDPQGEWVRLDLNDSADLGPVLQDIDLVYYLVHGMGEGVGYRQRDRSAAQRLADGASKAGVGRIVYLGGVQPAQNPSPHLGSRLETGQILRSGSVPCIELRAGMIIGPGSASWKICRDLAARLPFMLLPKWLQSRSEPVFIDDVIAALAAAADASVQGSAVFDLPGPEICTAEAILLRIARQRGTRPLTISVPILTPKLSSYWLKLISGADFSIARELVAGLESDLVSSQPSFWTHLGDHQRVSLDDAIRRTLQVEGKGSLRSQVLEGVARRASATVQQS